ncbi:hypothetical protein BVG19_g483 [[Candida] boidinii]|nr:hypothetical protein BVG19_g483 [[Candida] boidinii]OWB50276.1 hypothetical protein B5S27_g1824 [[Candida] boidinii]
MSDYEDNNQVDDYLLYESIGDSNTPNPTNIPEPVVNFISYWYNHYLENNLYELYGCYENSWNKLTEKFFKSTTWPNPSEISPIVQNDQIFLILYSECYYRHIYSKLSPSLEVRAASYDNYCNLFNLILNNPEGPVSFELPNKWLWDIIDEFIYQFNSFQLFKNKVLNRSNHSNNNNSNNNNNNNEEATSDLQFLKENRKIWSTYSVLNALYSLVSRSNITEQLKYFNIGQQVPIEISGKYGSKSLYKNLGYFSIVGLLRIHTLLGDYTLALKTMEHIELNKKAFLTKVPGCHFSTYYYIGFCYLMMNRYSDAIKSFQHILLFISRTKNLNKNSGAYDIITKRSDQMFALLTICISLCPTKLDDILHQQLKDKFGEQLVKLIRNENAIAVYEELFKFGSPKFISSCIVKPKSSVKVYNDPLNTHWRIFKIRLEANLNIPNLKSYLNLYSSLELNKLEKLMELKNQDELLELLLSFKLHNKQLKSSSKNTEESEDNSNAAVSTGTTTTEPSENENDSAPAPAAVSVPVSTSKNLLNGSYAPLYDIDITIDNEHINILNYKNPRKFGDWFIRNTIKNYSVQDYINNLDPSKVKNEKN